MVLLADLFISEMVFHGFQSLIQLLALKQRVLFGVGKVVSHAFSAVDEMGAGLKIRQIVIFGKSEGKAVEISSRQCHGIKIYLFIAMRFVWLFPSVVVMRIK